MGNCIPVSSSVQDDQVALNFSDLMENLSYILGNYSYSYMLDYAEVEPCHSYYCPLFQRVAPAFLAATCVLAALGNGALLAALAKRWRSWGGPVGRAAAAQLAAAALLFALPLAPLASGIARGWHLGPALCRAAHGLRHWGLFAQGLLVAAGPWGDRGWPAAAALWAAALLLAAPAALSSGTVAAAPPACVLRAQGALAPAALALLALTLALLLLLPLVAAVATRWRRHRREGASWAPWLFFALWAPYGAGLAGDALLRAGLLGPTCGAFEAFDTALGLAEALGVLHCGLVPLLLLVLALRSQQHPRGP